MASPTLPRSDPGRALQALLPADPSARTALACALDLAHEAACRGDRAVYSRILRQHQDGEPLHQIAATLEAERDRDDY